MYISLTTIAHTLVSSSISIVFFFAQHEIGVCVDNTNTPRAARVVLARGEGWRENRGGRAFYRQGGWWVGVSAAECIKPGQGCRAQSPDTVSIGWTRATLDMFRSRRGVSLHVLAMHVFLIGKRHLFFVFDIFFPRKRLRAASLPLADPLSTTLKTLFRFANDWTAHTSKCVTRFELQPIDGAQWPPVRLARKILRKNRF